MAGVLQYFLTRHLLLVTCTLREVCRRSDAAKSLQVGSWLNLFAQTSCHFTV